MRLRNHSSYQSASLILLLFLSNCRGGPPLPASLEAAVLANDWNAVALATSQMSGTDAEREAAVFQAYAALSRGETAAAVRHFLTIRSGGRATPAPRWAEQLGARHPELAVTQLFAGDALVRKGAYRAAVARFDAALSLDSNLSVALLARGVTRLLTDQREAALQDLEPLTADGPLAADALIARSLAHMANDQLDQALANLDSALALAPDHAVAYNARGIVYARLSDWVASADDFNTAFHLAPQIREARQNWHIVRRVAQEHGTVITGQKNITVVVTDLGIENWKSDLKMFDNFDKAKAGSVVPNLSKQGQILIPMPGDKAFPKTESEKQMLGQEIARGIINRIESGGLKTYEVRMVQNINKLGYFSRGRQEKVQEFGEIFYGALDMVKDHFNHKGTRAEMKLVGGSNGAHVAAEILPKMGHRNPIDQALLIDGRAKVASAEKLIEIMPGKVSILNTKGDALSGRYMIGNFDGAKDLKRKHPDKVTVILANPKGVDLWAKDGQLFPNHISVMRKTDSRFLFKEFNSRDLVPMGERTGWDMMWGLIRSQRASAATMPGGIMAGPLALTRAASGQVIFQAGSGSEEMILVYPLFGRKQG